MEENINELIIKEAQKRLKEGVIKNNNDLENFIDGLIQPLYQGMLNTELDNLLDYLNMNIKKIQIILEMVIAKLKTFKQSMEQ